MSDFSFRTSHDSGSARLGWFSTPHGAIETCADEYGFAGEEVAPEDLAITALRAGDDAGGTRDERSAGSC